MIPILNLLCVHHTFCNDILNLTYTMILVTLCHIISKL